MFHLGCFEDVRSHNIQGLVSINLPLEILHTRPMPFNMKFFNKFITTIYFKNSNFLLKILAHLKNALINILYKKLQKVPNFAHLESDIRCNQKVKDIIVTEVTVRSPFITYCSQNPWNFLDMEVIMIKLENFLEF